MPVEQMHHESIKLASSHRLALINLDWAHVRAVDIYAVFKSLVSEVGDIKDVTVYVSQYGQLCMQQEALCGHSASSSRVLQVSFTGDMCLSTHKHN